MISLFIDTSLSDVSIALLRDGKILSKIHEENPQKHSTYVAKYIQDIFIKNKLSPREVDEIVVINGPGSFTGIRIGVTIAKTYAYLLNIRIVTINSLLARVIGVKKNYLLSTIDAKHSNYYIGLYDKDYNKIIEKFVPLKELEELKEKYSAAIINQTKEYDIEKIIEYTKRIPNMNPHAINPLYLKLPEAMEKK